MRLGRRRLRSVVAGGVAVALTGGGVAAYALGEDQANYRTVVADTGTVTRDVGLTGTVEANGQADLSFGSGGTVSSVRVATGDSVRAGQVLATLDRRSLRATLRSAQADLAEAEAQLEADQDSQSDTVSAAVGDSTSGSGTSGSGTSGGGSSPAGSSSGGQAQSFGAPTPTATSSSPSDSSTSSPSGAPSTGDGSGPSTGSLEATLAALTEQQEAVTSAQSSATEAISSAKAALARQTAACATAFRTSATSGGGAGSATTAAFVTSSQVDTSQAAAPSPEAPQASAQPSIQPSARPSERPSVEPSSSPSSSAPPTGSDGSGSGDGGGDGGDGSPTDDAANAACSQALATVQAEQDAVAAAQDTLQSAIAELTSTLDDAVGLVQSDGTGSGGAGAGAGEPGATGGSGGTAGGSGGTAGGSPSGGGGSAAADGSGGSGAARTDAAAGAPTTAATPESEAGGAAAGGSISGAGGSDNTSTATTLANDQATIDTAEVSLLAARTALEGAVITAPFSGRVGAVEVTREARVSAGTTAVVVVSKKVTNVTASATEEQVTSLTNGQRVKVTMPGSSKGLKGTVTAISRLPETSTSTAGVSSSTSYPVHVVVDNVGSAMPVGSRTSVSVEVGRSARAVTVPTSAVTRTTSTAGTVQVLDDGRAVRRMVTVGEVGSSRTAITAGLSDGTEVVLADVDQAVPTGDSTTAGGRGFGGSGPGGGGLGGGGFGGGAPPGLG